MGKITDPLRVYVAGKVSKDSIFGTHHWRSEFIDKLEELTGLNIENLDPLKSGVQHKSPEEIFTADVNLIKKCDLFIVYLSDDISVGGSQEILVAKYFAKPVIGLAPKGGKFNGATKEMLGKKIKNYKDPFVFATCDKVVGDIEELAGVLTRLSSIKPKTLDHLMQ